MRGKAGSRLRQVVAAGVLVGAVLGVPVGSAVAQEARPVIEVEPGASFTLSGGGCLWDEGDGGATHPGLVGVGLVNAEEIELEEPTVYVLPNTAQADDEGDWSVTNAVPTSLVDGDYFAAPVCIDPHDEEREPRGRPESVKTLRVARPATPGTSTTTEAPPPAVDPGDIDNIVDDVKPPTKPAPKPATVKAAPKFTG